MPGQMQEGFGCAITNRFDQLFDDESDPFELLKQAEIKKKEAAALAALKPVVPAVKPQKKESQKDRKTPLADKKEEFQAPVPIKKDGVRMRGMGRRPEGEGPRPQGQGGPGEGRPPADRRPVDRRPPRRFERPAGEGGERPGGEGGEFSVEKPIGDRPMRGRGGGPRGARGGGVTRGRGMGRTDGFDSRGKREFDRHSGSDRSASFSSGLKGEEKRGGSGSHNWGTVKDELTGELDQSNVTEENPEGEEHPAADSENKENEAEEPKDESPKEMTLDEWKAVQDKERAKVEFNIRKANEGADWKKGYVLHKSKKDEEKGTLIEAEADEVPKAEDEHRKPANDITAQLEINFGDLGRPGRGRGGRGRGEGRGGRGRGEGRGEARGGEGPAARPARGGRGDKASGVSVPNVDDPEAFPALA
ncbi:SERPINE1 mRNA-binding protein 1 isoform X1 [Gadus morhua]|uniref:SERPINE1 mRNA-binding protein 1 isoform X1 n=1 Tax=Gadus morhua TaxID=8049 RepID=UPI0011B76162|nr:plasminogen activator inhibitor 1 RNA-binding protein-like isoform X1 [Gadus morhua]